MPTSRRALTLSALDFPRFLLDRLPAHAGLPFAHLHQVEVTKVHQVEVTKVHQVEVIKVHQVQFINLHQGGVHLARVEQSIYVAWEIENSNTDIDESDCWVMSCFQLFCFRFPLRNSQAAAERDQLLRCDAVKPAVTSLSHWLRNLLPILLVFNFLRFSKAAAESAAEL